MPAPNARYSDIAPQSPIAGSVQIKRATYARMAWPLAKMANDRDALVFAPVARDFAPMPSSIRNALLWIFDAFERDSTYVSRRMFGCDAAYLDGLLWLVAADRDEPWNGLLVCTSQARHAALIDEMPALRPHPVIGKWLYVSQEDPAFETVVERMTALVLARDPRVGVEPKPRNQSRKSVLPGA